MATFYIGNNSTVNNFTGGATGEAAKNLIYRVTFGGVFNVGDSFSFNVVTSAVVYTCGIGRITGAIPVSALTLYNKLNFISGTTWFFSDNSDCTGFEQQSPGAGLIVLSNQFAMPEPLVSLTQYQGMMCVQSRRTSQIWVIDPNPNNYTLFQTLANIGSFAPLGSCALGDLDVVFPYDSGIRSLRARDVTLNATPSDIGSAVDEIVQAQLLTLDDALLLKSCAIIEPNQNRYWLSIPNGEGGANIYVLSYFPTNKIVAWSVYTATYVNTLIYDFQPDKFVVLNGQVYIGTSIGIFIFGGTDNNTYDAVPSTIQLPFYDEKRPGHEKWADHIDCDVEGTWNVSGTPDWINGDFDTIGSAGQATFDNGNVGFQDRGTHFSFQLQSTEASYSKVSSLIFYYNLGAEPPS